MLGDSAETNKPSDFNVLPQPRVVPQHSLVWVRWLASVGLLCRVIQGSMFLSSATRALQKKRKRAEDLRTDFRGRAWKYSCLTGQAFSHALTPTLGRMSKHKEAYWFFSLIFEQKIDSACETEAQRSKMTYDVTKLINNIAQIPIKDYRWSVWLGPNLQPQSLYR